jgi:Ca2+-binding RTX toxin-like protein
MRREDLAGVVVALGCLALPGGATAATVSVQGPSHEYLPDLYTLTVAAAPGEANAVSVSLAGTDSGNATWAVTDAGAAPDAGAGCTAAGPGRVNCTVPKSRLPSGCGRVGCTDYGAGLIISLDLGDGDDSIDLSSLPADGDGGGVVSSDIRTGIGADTVTGSPLVDNVDPGTGADTVATGTNHDIVRAAAGAPDGPDRIDLGAGPDDAITYEAATGPVSITLDDVPNDGAPGEGDDVSGAEIITGGPGDDVIAAPAVAEASGISGSATVIRGGQGADRITGGPGPDVIDGDSSDGTGGADVIDGAGGNDLIRGWNSGDRLVGGSGVDTVNGGAGGDRISGNAGRDTLAGENGGDTLLAAGGGRDRVSCGGGDDDARADRRDRVSDCEHLRG